MSAPSKIKRCEPNLTPLLDIVLQMLMFFMMCVNFVSNQVTREITLPRSGAVKPIDKTDPDWLYVNFKPFHLREFENKLTPEKLEDARRNFQEGDPTIYVVGEPDAMKLSRFRSWLKTRYEEADRLAQAPGGTKKVNTCIVIRADKDANYGMVFEIMNMCKVIGYKRLKMQATIENKKGGK
jgi:biopolymer transport protein ExbD